MTCFRFLAIIDLQNRFNTKAKITRIRLNNMKKPRSIPIICWTNIIINYLNYQTMKKMIFSALTLLSFAAFAQEEDTTAPSMSAPALCFLCLI